MNDNISIVQRMSLIRELLLEYEKETLPLFVCPADEVSGFISRRNAIMEKLREQNNLLAAQCAQDESGKVAAAAKCSCDRGSLSGELAEIFDAKLEINAVLTRLIAAEKQASERIAHERDGLAEKIRDINQGHNAQAAKYYDASRYNTENYFFPPESKKI